jgi:site-specific DNA recombinase
MVCAEHGYACFGCAKDGKPAYGTNVLGECSIGIKRAPVDEFIREVVVQRLSRPDAAEVLKASETTDPSQEIAVLQLRRDDLTVLLGKGLVQLSVVEPQLEEIKEQLWRLEGNTPKTNILQDALIDPAEAWDRWNVPERREALRILFSEIALAHSSSEQGPRVRLERVRLSWRA